MGRLLKKGKVTCAQILQCHKIYKSLPINNLLSNIYHTSHWMFRHPMASSLRFTFLKLQ